MFRSQKHLRNGWAWRRNWKVLKMEPRKTWHNLSTSKTHKINFPQWMTNVRKLLTLIQVNLGRSGWTLFLAKTEASNLMISSFRLALVYVSESTYVLRIRVTDVKVLNGTAHTIFLTPKLLVASHVMLLSIFSLGRCWDLSTGLQCLSRVAFSSLWQTP